MTTRSLLFLALLLCLPIAALQQSALGQSASAAIDPKADEILKQMGKVLADAKSFSLDVHNTADVVLPSGQVVQFARNQRISVRRPGRMAVAMVGDREETKFAYDGKQVVMCNVLGKTWSSVAAPATIDETMDMLANQYGMALPLVDLVFSDPYKDLIARAKSAEYLGTGYVLDVKCHHLAFRQDSVDWQIWVEEGEKPLPRKLVITYKESPNRPQYVAMISNWNLSAEFPDEAFQLNPPADAKKVDFAAPPPAIKPER